MTPLLLALTCALIVATSFVSGLFGMAGGLILIGFLLVFLPVPAAMMLHGATQIVSNGWRAVLWRNHVVWRPVAAYALGCSIAFAIWSIVLYVPDKAVVIVALGLSPFLLKLLPSGKKPDPESALQGTLYGIACMSLMLLTGVAGPMLDQFFLNGKLDRRQIIATKGMCQVFGHGLKLVYFGGMVTMAGNLDPTAAIAVAGAAIAGTILAKQYLERMTERQFHVWTNGLIFSISGYYICYGCYLMYAGQLA